MLNDITALLVVVLTNLVVVGGAYLGARKLGLTDLQKQVQSTTAVLVDRLKARVSDLEAENARLRSEVQTLKEQNRLLEERVDALQAAIADRVIKTEPHRER